jgi:hypothetical protein
MPSIRVLDAGVHIQDELMAKRDPGAVVSSKLPWI